MPFLFQEIGQLEGVLVVSGWVFFHEGQEVFDEMRLIIISTQVDDFVPVNGFLLNEKAADIGKSSELAVEFCGASYLLQKLSLELSGTDGIILCDPT